MLTKETLEWIKIHGKADQIEAHNLIYTDRTFSPILPLSAACLSIYNLSGLKDYVDSEFDGQNKLMIHVSDSSTVYLRGELNTITQSRELFAKAELCINTFSFDNYLNLETFIAELQSRFVKTEARDTVLKVVGNLKLEESVQTQDDGTTQSVTAKTGIARVEKVNLPNPVLLRPYRTFLEVEQPESDFVLRIKTDKYEKEQKIALFEADGGKWKNEAVDNIKAYFGKLGKVTVIG